MFEFLIFKVKKDSYILFFLFKNKGFFPLSGGISLSSSGSRYYEDITPKQVMGPVGPIQL